MELGCFMAGVVLSSNGEHLVHKVSNGHFFLILFLPIISVFFLNSWICKALNQLYSSETKFN